MASCVLLSFQSPVFIFSHGLQGCLEAQGWASPSLSQPAMPASSPAQRWKWVSPKPATNLGTMQRLGTGWPGTNTTAPGHVRV